MKVLCKYCKFLKRSGEDYGPSYLCKHPFNIRIKHNWFRQYKKDEHLPQQINWDNNCTWFEPKWWVVWFVKERKWNSPSTKS